VSSETRFLQLSCPACRWTEVCGRQQVAGWLRKLRQIRPGREPELEIMHEVLRAVAGRLTCPQCGRTGLATTPTADENEDVDWPEARTCSACSKIISKERLEAVPEATLCAACKRAEQPGTTEIQTEYCPRCGALMELRLGTSAGVTRYVLVCTGNPPCRS